MPCSYTIDRERELVCVFAEGVFTDEEIVAVSRQVAVDPQYNCEYRFFCDFRAVAENLTTAKSMSLVPRILKHAPRARCVILFRWTWVNFGMFRMYSAYCAVYGFSVPRCFHDHEKALAFLNDGAAPEKALH
jgi:hypothetical protein